MISGNAGVGFGMRTTAAFCRYLKKTDQSHGAVGAAPLWAARISRILDDMTETRRRANAKQRVLEALVAYRVRTNVELLTVCFRYGSRIHELRREGHVIQTQAIGGGLYAYHYLGQTTTPELPF